jgi:hypothetical protein
MLPKCSIPIKQSELTKYVGDQVNFNKDERFKIEKLISKCINSDCWALSVDSIVDEYTETLFNKYDEEILSFKENIMNNIMRQTISSNPHGSLLVLFYRRSISANINIYFHKNSPLKIQIYYNQDNKEFSISGFTEYDSEITYTE